MEAEQDAGAIPRSVRTPPYISYKTMTTVLEDMREVGIPPRLDRSVLTRFSGGVGGQILMAFKSLALIEDDGTPTEALQRIVGAYGGPSYPAELRSVLKDAYPFLAALDLGTATPSMFADAFKNATDAKEDVLRKCRTFYLHAAREAGVEIGARLEKGSFPRSSSNGTSSRRKKKRTEPAFGDTPPPAVPQAQSAAQKELEYQLVDLMTEPDIEDDVKQSIWKLVQYLTARKQKKAAASNDAAASS